MCAAISPRDRQDYCHRALRAADWFRNSQIRPEHHFFADVGRFLYYYYKPEQRSMPGINWSHGRAIFTLTDAYRASGEKKYLESAEEGARFILALQQMDAGEPVTHGGFREETPQCTWGSILDGAQAGSALVMLYEATGKERYLRRARAFGEFLLRHWSPATGLPGRVDFEHGRVDASFGPWHGARGLTMRNCTAIPLWHLYRVTGEGRYVPPLLNAADRILQAQRPDGAFNFAPRPGEVRPPVPNHHEGYGEGDEKYIIRNDDGLVTVILGAYRATDDAKYLDAMCRYADWIVAQGDLPERPFVAYGIQACNVWDIAREAGRDYTDWILRNLPERGLALQVEQSGDPRAEGGFCGEDEEGDTGVYGGVATEYVVTRVTCYMAGLLFRLSGRAFGSGFSVEGLGGKPHGADAS